MFLLHYNVLQKKAKKQKGRTTNYITCKESPNYLALAFDLVTSLAVDIHVNLHVMENKQHGSFTYNFKFKKTLDSDRQYE